MYKRITKLVVSTALVIGVYAAYGYAQNLKIPPHIDLFQYAKMGEGGYWHHHGVEKFRLWGWARNGLVAYSTETVGPATGALEVKFIILNIVTDKEAFRLDAEDDEGNGTFEMLYNKNRGKIAEALKRHNIIEQQTPFRPFPIRKAAADPRIHADTLFHATTVETFKTPWNEDMHPGQMKIGYRVIVNRDGVLSKTIKTVDSASGLDVTVAGYFMSPYENRAMVVIAKNIWTFEGSEVFFRFSGCHLGTGFRDNLPPPIELARGARVIFEKPPHHPESSHFELAVSVRHGGRKTLLYTYANHLYKISPDRARIAYIYPLEWEADASTYVFDIVSGKKIKLTHKDFKDNITAKDLKWLDDEYLLVIYGNSAGTVTRGGDVYICNSADGKCEMFIRAPRPDGWESCVVEITRARYRRGGLGIDAVVIYDNAEKYHDYTEIIPVRQVNEAIKNRRELTIPVKFTLDTCK